MDYVNDLVLNKKVGYLGYIMKVAIVYLRVHYVL